jgi:hypothetical protein
MIVSKHEYKKGEGGGEKKTAGSSLVSDSLSGMQPNIPCIQICIPDE